MQNIEHERGPSLPLPPPCSASSSFLSPSFFNLFPGECSLEDYVTCLRRQWWRYSSNPFRFNSVRKREWRRDEDGWMENGSNYRTDTAPHSGDYLLLSMVYHLKNNNNKKNKCLSLGCYLQWYVLSTISHRNVTVTDAVISTSVCFC